MRARNVYGWQPAFSDPPVTLVSSEAPGFMNTLTTTYDSATDPFNIKIEWTKPDENSNVITGYEILIKAKDGTYIEDLVDCNADQEPVLTDLTCNIPLTTLRQSPYSLIYGDLVVAIGRAQNTKGFG